jgi:hypothetical protein
MTRPHLLAATTLGFLAAGAFVGHLSRRAWSAVVDYRPVYRFAKAAGARRPALAERVVLVVVDGLRLDVSRQLPRLNALRERGADFESAAAGPSFSRPGRATLVTGAWAAIHGVTSNFHERALDLDSLFRRAGEEGLSCAVAGSDIYPSLFRADLSCAGDALLASTSKDPAGLYRQAEPRMKVFSRKSVELMLAQRPAFGVLDFLATDYSAHDFGPRSEDHRRAALDADGRLGELVDGLDLETTALLVTSDHGHVDEGGHGGIEPEVLRIPLVLAGRGVRRGARGAASQADVAPTVAALLGLPIPAATQGRVLLGALATTDEQRAAILEAEWQQRSAFLRDFSSALDLPRPALPEPARDAAAFEEAVERADALVRLATSDRARSDVRRRLRAAAVVLLLPLVPLALALRRRRSPRERAAFVAALLVYGGAFFLLLELRRVRISLSALNHEEDLGPYFARIMIFSALSATAALLAALGIASRSAAYHDLFALGLTVVGALAYLVAAQVAVFHATEGLLPAWSLPDFGRGFRAFVNLIQLQSLCYAALLVPGMAWAVARWTAPRALASPPSPA